MLKRFITVFSLHFLVIFVMALAYRDVEPSHSQISYSELRLSQDTVLVSLPYELRFDAL